MSGFRPNPSAKRRNTLREHEERKVFMYIKLYLTQSEKLQLEALAAKKNISVSGFCHDRIFPLPSALPDAIDSKDNRKETYSHAVKVYFTASEYATLLSDANGLPLSRYIRKEFLSRKEPVQISVYTDDISALTMNVSSYIEQLHHFIAALAIRRQLYEADYERLMQIAEDTRSALREAAGNAKANRSSIRASGVRILRKEIKHALNMQFSGERKDIKL